MLWRGTLNADRKAQWMGAGLFNGSPKGEENAGCLSRNADDRNPCWSQGEPVRSGVSRRMPGISGKAKAKGRPTRDALPLRP